jgi:hypothetical protein
MSAARRAARLLSGIIVVLATFQSLGALSIP